jgi:outer membrane protein OmpA-like peptidoglycan-associated protein
VGANVSACRIVQLQTEITGKVYGDTTVRQTHTADLIVGASFWLKPGLYVRPAYSYAIGYDGRGRDVSSGKRSGFQLSVGYHGGTPCCEIYTPPPPPPAPANRLPPVSVTCEPSPVLPGQVSKCRATASDPDGDPLTYAWTAGAGRISGTGAQVSLDTAGIKAGDCTPVTVKVADGRGGTAEATTRVCVQEPPKPKPEAVTCTSGGFPRNLSRLNNVDKACLDDVASKLRQDPRSRVIIVGHADSAERHPEVIGRKRAEAVKDYLVKERGVAEARITAKSAADSKPLDTAKNARARAKNRRVDVIFVPEGATVPEDD